MNSLSAKKFSSCKVIKLRRKLKKEEILPSQEDFSLENSGDIRSFLSPVHPSEVHSRNSNSSIYNQNLIGAHSLVQTPKPDATVIRKATRKPTLSFTFRNNSRQQTMSLKEDSKNKFDSIIKKINYQIELSKLEEKNQLLSLPIQDRKAYKKQIHSLDSITSTKMLDDSSTRGCEFGNIKKEISKKKTQENYDFGQINWYMQLRESNENEHIETYLRIGSDINGIYSKACIPNPNYKRADEWKTREPKNLVVVGKNKLSLEIDAVKKTGFEYLKPDLIANCSCKENEVFGENYLSKRGIKTPASISSSKSYLISELS